MQCRSPFDREGRASVTAFLALLVLLGSACVGSLPAAAAPSDVDALRAHAGELIQQLKQSLIDTGVPFSRLQSELIDVAGRLETAGLDSLASDARFGAARA